MMHYQGGQESGVSVVVAAIVAVVPLTMLSHYQCTPVQNGSFHYSHGRFVHEASRPRSRIQIDQGPG